MSRALDRLRWTHKKVSRSQRTGRSRSRGLARGGKPSECRQLIFVDESGTHVALTPLYAWAPKVQRARVPGAAQPWENYHQAFCPLASQGSRRASPIEGGTDARAFATSVREVLAPTLEPGQIVILDKPFCAPG